MSMVRFPVDKYASLELNQVAFPKTGLVVSQTPLDAAFTADAPCENGMGVLADKAAGTIKAAAAVTDTPMGIVYTAEKEYDVRDAGLKNFAQKGGDYPRVGIMSVGETYTSNCFQYNDGTYATCAALETALKACATTPMYVGQVAGSAVPQLVAAKPASGVVGKVVKYYTMPNGEPGVKYQIISL